VKNISSHTNTFFNTGISYDKESVKEVIGKRSIKMVGRQYTANADNYIANH